MNRARSIFLKASDNVKIYGWIEVVTGVIKLVFLVIIIICLPIAIYKFPKQTKDGSEGTEGCRDSKWICRRRQAQQLIIATNSRSI